MDVPDKATMSVVERPLTWNVEIRTPRLEMGEGKKPVLLAAEKLAVFESLLPTLTSQLGPPSYNMHVSNF